MKRITTAITAGFAAVLAFPVLASAATDPIIIDNLAEDGWVTFLRSGGTAEISADFGAPAGFGNESLKLSTPVEPKNDSKANVKRVVTAPLQLDDLTQLDYHSYRSSTSTVSPGLNASATTALNVEVDVNGLDVEGGYTTLVYEPVYQTQLNQPVTPDVWQQWKSAEGTAVWWSTKPIESAPNVDTFPTLAAIKAANPNAVVLSYGINQGGGNPGLIGTADGLTINGTAYDFETVVETEEPEPVVATSKDQCKDGGFANFVDASGNAFKNQGSCVSFVASKGKSQGNGPNNPIEAVIAFVRNVVKQ
jgi:hypothetical protein